MTNESRSNNLERLENRHSVSDFRNPQLARQHDLQMRRLISERQETSSNPTEQQQRQLDTSRRRDLQPTSQSDDVGSNLRRPYTDDDLGRVRPDSETKRQIQWLEHRFTLERRLNLQSHNIRQEFNDLNRAIENYTYFTESQRQELNPVRGQYQQAIENYRNVIQTAVDAELQAPGTKDGQVQEAYDNVRNAAEQANDTLRRSVLEHEPNLQHPAEIQRDLAGLQQGIERYRYFTEAQREELGPFVNNYEQALNNYERTLNNYERARGASPHQELAARQQVLDANRQVSTIANGGWDAMWEARNANDPGDLRIVYDDFSDFIAETANAVRNTGRALGFGGMRVLANVIERFGVPEEREIFNRVERVDDV